MQLSHLQAICTGLEVDETLTDIKPEVLLAFACKTTTKCQKLR